MAPPSVRPNVDTHGHRVFYGPLAMQSDPWNLMPDDLPRVCSHYYRKVVCDWHKFHWPADQPYIKYKHPKRCFGNSCNCPKEPGDPDMPAKRTAYVRPYGPGPARAQPFGDNLAWIPIADCEKCQERKKRAKDDSAAKSAKRRGGDGGGGGGSAGSKRKEGSDSKAEQKAKERRTENGSGRMRYDPVRG